MTMTADRAQLLRDLRAEAAKREIRAAREGPGPVRLGLDRMAKLLRDAVVAIERDLEPIAVDIHGAAQHTGLSTHQIRKATKEGRGPVCSHLGRAIRYEIRELDKWVASGHIPLPPRFSPK